MNIKQLAERIKFPIIDRNPYESFHWDGQSLSLKFIDSKQNVIIRSDYQILHEICHWLIAEKWQRNLPEYGLYSDSFSPPKRDYDSDYDSTGVVDILEQEIQERGTWLLQMKLFYAIEIEHHTASDFHRGLRKELYFYGDEAVKKARKAALRGIKELRKLVTSN